MSFPIAGASWMKMARPFTLSGNNMIRSHHTKLNLFLENGSITLTEDGEYISSDGEVCFGMAGEEDAVEDYLNAYPEPWMW